MEIPKNLFKSRLKAGQSQLGLWNCIGGNTVPEMLGHAGFDWVLVDSEHAPIGTAEILPALQAIGQVQDCPTLVRPVANDPVLIKQILDQGAQTLMIPYVQTPQEAEAAVRAMRYGPEGIRGMAGMSRATRYGAVDDYFNTAEEELCLVVQVETIEAMRQLEAIACTEGVDAVFIGPADLSASMGLRGQLSHPDVVGVIVDAFDRLAKIGVPGGVMAPEEAQARHYIEHGSKITAVGVDSVLLAKALSELRQTFAS